jgi:hypothetical protein
MDEAPLNNKINKNSQTKLMSGRNKESEKLNDFISKAYKNEEMQNKSNNNSLIKNQISDEKIEQENNDKSLYENEEEEYNYELLMAKLNELEEENKNLNEELQKNELIIEEQDRTISLLRSSIENDFFKNNDIIKYITTENIVDFIQLKNENEQYKKELVLSQALVNSLQAENLRLNQNKEENKEENSDLINVETDDFLSNSENKLNEFNSENSKENEVIKELNKENNILKKLIQEATVKLNNLLNNEKTTKILYDDNNILNFQLQEKNEIIMKYEEKLTFFNGYISDIKSSFNKARNYIINSINSYNKIANEDLNSLLSNSFSQNMMKLSMQISNMDEIEQYNLETRPELDLHNIFYELLSSISDEFIILYEKVFQTNNYYKEANNKAIVLEQQLRELNMNNLINSNNEIMKLKDEYVKTIIKLNLELSSKENDNYYLKENIISMKQNLNDMENILALIIKVLNNSNEINLANYLKNFLDSVKEKMDLIMEKEETIQKIMKNNHKIKNMKLDNKNVENLKFYEDEDINHILNDYNKKIKEKENRIVINKEQITTLLC